MLVMKKRKVIGGYYDILFYFAEIKLYSRVKQDGKIFLKKGLSSYGGVYEGVRKF